MATRAAFWIGDPRRPDTREWLGCKAFDGYPENSNLLPILVAGTADEFRAAVAHLAKEAKDFARPDGGWPYPWAGDIFLTDYTYAFFDGKVQATCFHHGFRPIADVLIEGFEWPDGDDLSLHDVRFERPYDPSQPDSIIIMTIPR